MIKKKMIKRCLLKLLLCLLLVWTWRSSHRLMAIPNNSMGGRSIVITLKNIIKLGSTPERGQANTQ